IRSFVQDLNAQLLAAIDAEFEKVASRPVPAPTRQQKLLSGGKGKGGSGGGDGGAGAASTDDLMDDLFPRVDITTQLGAQVIQNMGDAQWKVRKEGLDEFMRVLEACNKRVKPNLGSEIIPALKARLGDSNRNLAIQALDITGTLATSVGKPFEKHAKILAAPITGCLADNKALVRTAALNALEKVYEVTGFDPLISAFGTSLMADQPLLRKDLLKWLAEKFEATKKEGQQTSIPDLTPLVHAILLCLQDRNAEVRKSAQTVLGFVVESVGFDFVRERAGDLFKGAQLQSIVPAVEAFRGVGGGSAASAAAESGISRPGTAKGKPGTPLRSKRSSSLLSRGGEGAENASGGPGKLGGPGGMKGAKRVSRLPGRKDTTSAADSGSAGGALSTGKEAPLLTSDFRSKEQRADRDRGMNKWTFDLPRRELVDLLNEQCETHFSPEVHAWLFSTDHYKERDFLSALSALDEPISNPATRTAVLDALGVDFDELKKRYIANADLILKYITLRFFDTNTSMLIRCLELLEHLFALMDEEGYHLTEYEASCFLPFFVNKTGDNKESMRLKIRGILKQLCRIYPASRLFNYLIKGLESKNSRTRIECLEELASLIQRNGIGVANASKTFPLIAAQISDRDAGVRNGAINAITQAYMQVGEVVYKYVGRISEKDKSLLEEKFKRLPAPMPGSQQPPAADTSVRASTLGRLGARKGESNGPMAGVERLSTIGETGVVDLRASTTSLSGLGGIGGLGSRQGSSTALANGVGEQLNVKKEFQLDLDKLDIPSLSTGSVIGPNPTDASGIAAPHQPALLRVASGDHVHSPGLRRSVSDLALNMSYLQHAAAASDPQLMNAYNYASNIATSRDHIVIEYIVTQITSGEVFQSIEAVKQLEAVVKNSPHTVEPYVDDIVSAVTIQIRIAFTAGDVTTSPNVARLCRHLVNVLVQLFSDANLAKALSQDPLHQCMQELLNRLLDPTLQAMENGSHLVRALNILILRILENCDRNASFSILLEILEQSANATQELPQEHLTIQIKYTELVMKCLWKVTKILPQIVASGQVRVDKLISDVHKFLSSSPPSEWKKRQSLNVVPQADMPLRTVKTILSELAHALQERVFDYLDLIAEPSRSHAVIYLKQMLDIDRKKKGLPPYQLNFAARQSMVERPPPEVVDSRAKVTEYLAAQQRHMEQEQQQQQQQQEQQFRTPDSSPPLVQQQQSPMYPPQSHYFQGVQYLQTQPYNQQPPPQYPHEPLSPMQQHMAMQSYPAPQTSPPPYPSSPQQGFGSAPQSPLTHVPVSLPPQVPSTIPPVPMQLYDQQQYVGTSPPYLPQYQAPSQVPTTEYQLQGLPAAQSLSPMQQRTSPRLHRRTASGTALFDSSFTLQQQFQQQLQQQQQQQQAMMMSSNGMSNPTTASQSTFAVATMPRSRRNSSSLHSSPRPSSMVLDAPTNIASPGRTRPMSMLAPQTDINSLAGRTSLSGGIPSPGRNSTSYLNSTTGGILGLHQPQQPQQQQLGSDAGAPSDSAGDSSASSAELDAQLTVIFGRICDKELTKVGIQELYDFQKRHPYTEQLVNHHLSKTGSYFQGYIKRGLAQLATEEQK
ncbi:Microtubule-associated protein, microtubule dynamics during spindle orientation, partial [Quaeritorhiza haematococci]